jgi:hypothetical protein
MLNLQALGPGFAQFAEPVFQRCINLIQSQQLAKVCLLFAFYNIFEFESCSLNRSSHPSMLLFHAKCSVTVICFLSDLISDFSFFLFISTTVLLYNHTSTMMYSLLIPNFYKE